MRSTNRRRFGIPLFALAMIGGALLLASCGGGGGGPSAPSPYSGTYMGAIAVTNGPDKGVQSQYTITIGADGQLHSTNTDVHGNVATLTGSVDGNGHFIVAGAYNGRIIVSGSGQLTVQGTTVTGSGTFQTVNGDQGTIQVTRNIAA